MSKAGAFFLDLLYPKRCPVCAKVSTSGEPCAKCADELASLQLEHVIPKRLFCDGVIACYKNEGGAHSGVYRMKFEGAGYLCEYFARELAARVQLEGVSADIVLAVPAGKASMSERGYNTSLLLARELAKALALPLESEILTKDYETPTQHSLPAYKRQGNLAGAFSVKDAQRIKGKTVLVCDDIMTTGNSMQEIAKTLKLFGAARVYGAIVLYT